MKKRIDDDFPVFFQPLTQFHNSDECVGQKCKRLAVLADYRSCVCVYRLLCTGGLTEAAAPVVREHKAHLADTLEASGGVGARAKLADVGLHLALVDV